jgi:hypothetical protein
MLQYAERTKNPSNCTSTYNKTSIGLELKLELREIGLEQARLTARLGSRCSSPKLEPSTRASSAHGPH